MEYNQFVRLVHQQTVPVILLEGTRRLPPEDEPKLTEFAQALASKFPQARFRTGNASGSDEAFADGVSLVDPQRLEYVVPYRSMRQRSRKAGACCISLEDAVQIEAALAAETIKASPKYRNWIENRQKIQEYKAKSGYLLRDTLKVTGIEQISFPAAHVGIFYVNSLAPEKGGTGHTMRVCRSLGVPVITQADWMPWLHRRLVRYSEHLK